MADAEPQVDAADADESDAAHESPDPPLS